MANAIKMILCAGMTVAVLAGCEKKDEPAQGPAETLGRKIDNAAEKGAVELNRMGESAGRAMEKAGESLQRKAQQAKDANDAKDANEAKPADGVNR